MIALRLVALASFGAIGSVDAHLRSSVMEAVAMDNEPKDHVHKGPGGLMSDRSLNKYELKLETTKEPCNTKVILTNRGKRIQHVVLWDSPFSEKFRGDHFKIEGATYGGIMAEMEGPIPPKHVKSLAQGDYLEKTIDLCTYYSFPKAGTYKVKAAYDLMVIFDEAGKIPLKQLLEAGMEESDTYQGFLVSNTIDLVVAEASFLELPGQELAKVDDRSSVNSRTQANTDGCSQSKINAINNAINDARTMIEDALTELPGGDWWNRGYRRDIDYWYGSEGKAASGSKNSDLKTHWTKMLNRLNANDITYYCKPQNGDCSLEKFLWFDTSYTLAYVYKSRDTKMYLCDKFFDKTSNLYAKTSQGGIIVHELAHYTSVADADDVAYGNSAARDLAKKSSTTDARTNADNYRAFGEEFARTDIFKIDKGRCDYIPPADWASCPSGYSNTAVSCYRGPHSYGKKCTLPWKKHGCKSGYTDMGCHCQRWASTKSLSSASCPSGTFRHIARCYNNCLPGFNKVNMGLNPQCNRIARHGCIGEQENRSI